MRGGMNERREPLPVWAPRVWLATNQHDFCRPVILDNSSVVRPATAYREMLLSQMRGNSTLDASAPTEHSEVRRIGAIISDSNDGNTSSESGNRLLVHRGGGTAADTPASAPFRYSSLVAEGVEPQGNLIGYAYGVPMPPPPQQQQHEAPQPVWYVESSRFVPTSHIGSTALYASMSQQQRQHQQQRQLQQHHHQQQEKHEMRNSEASATFSSRGGMGAHPRYEDPYARGPSNCRGATPNAVYSIPFRRAANAAPSDARATHAAPFSVGGAPLHFHLHHHYHHRPNPAPTAPPPQSPPQSQPQPQPQPQPHPQHHQLDASATGQADSTPARQVRLQQEATFLGLFERLAYRSNTRHPRDASSGTTSGQRRGEAIRHDRAHVPNGEMRSARTVNSATLSAPPLGFFRLRPGTPPPPHTLARDAHAPRTHTHSAHARDSAHMAEGYMFEAALAPDVDNMTYEELLDLAERIGRVERGVPRERLRQLRVVLQPYHFGPTSSSREAALPRAPPPQRKQNQSNDPSQDEDSITCCVCLDNFSVGDAAMQLPCCRHFLHNGCAGRWFEAQFRCPICNRDVRNTE
ncbi:Zinc finger (ISS) [Trypanosoma grayi]|uniref:Zinc finger (ISS) n=1 Tax=Trypanosoma grayi TaxID=71804 RepID=UPI0004F3F1B1|nr:Zinc finger (ISS) [Trypanosoma grayi]KEG06377.1 Zinc finger (ISS) [Trypanosoma grayi]